ncbi:ABC transporter permease/M1 family aminopeptidase [Glaciecola petra]|uniref:M1 family aminopeptidase n=1 Tax=Glaciecola petra TaxID=3075602 RepID=A0ABU2ZR26_9ALTE|nr:M1 family aminopeptidase [Aestuariibacter sp. P117]MDT0594049.1 M1 family aminopeptidase [Aestuariibacter sp. P117]
MFFRMIQFEWRFFIKQPSFIVTCLIFFLLPFLSVAIENVSIGSASNINFNSPYAIAQTVVIFGIFSLFLVVNFIGNTAIRNELSNMSELLYTKPINTFKYQVGRFIGSFLVILFVSAMVPLGLMLGSLSPQLDVDRLGEFNLFYYLVPYLIFSVPTLFALSTIIFAAALRFRSMLAVYLFALGLFILYALAEVIFTSPQQSELLAIFDPFGVYSFFETTQYWTPKERNSLVVSFSDLVLSNRLLWIGLGLCFLLFFGRIFSPLRLAQGRSKKFALKDLKYMPTLHELHSNRIDYSFQDNDYLQLFMARVKFEYSQIITSPAFIVLLLFAAFLIISTFVFASGDYGVRDWPITQYMVSQISNGVRLTLIIVITYYTAEVVWRERTVGIGDIIDSTPVPNFIFWLSKFCAVNFVTISVLVTGLMAALINQTVSGYTNYDLPQYIISLMYFEALPYILLTVLAFLIQALSPSKYVGMLIFVGYFLVSNFVMAQIGFEHNMFFYSSSPQMIFSDMNGYGWAMSSHHYYMLYWSALALVFSAFSFALWQRGPKVSLKSRWKLMGYHLGQGGQVLVVLGIVCFISVGTVIHYNTRVVNQFLLDEQVFELRAEYEKQYSLFEDAPLPSIVSVDINAAIFPNLRKIEVIADLTLINKTNESIDKFLINYPDHSRVEIESAEINGFNSDLKTAWMSFDKAMQPGQQKALRIKVTRQHFGFKDSDEDTSLVKNGTFIDNVSLLPTFGVQKNIYLSDQYERKKRDLPPPQRAYKLEDESRYNESFLGKHIGLIEFSATLSTDQSQIAIAPGYLQKYWVEGGRNYFQYKMDKPMINFYNLMSADLEVKSEIYNGVQISVYYHREHEWNVERMIQSSKDSLAFFEDAFGKYQHKQLRIIEFPGYRRFAQSFANTVPYSEQIGFIADLRDPATIDSVYYITAHEVAHQWFGHQLDAANVQGSAVLSESLSQYAALQVMRKQYGEVRIREFLSYELDAYLRGRSTEYLEEMPFMRVENQPYIYYHKGGIVLMAIADRIGFENMNRAIAGLIEQFKFSQGKRATTLDLLNAIKSVAEKSQYDFIEQQFSQITIYDIELIEAEVNTIEAGNTNPEKLHLIELMVNVKQFSVDGVGEETSQQFADLVDIVIFDGDPNDFSNDTNILYHNKHRLEDGENTLLIQLEAISGRPKFIGVDPFIRYIDRNSRDNILAL